MKIHVLDTSEGAEALKQYELSKYTNKELKDELVSREVGSHYECDIPEQHEVCEHNMEMGYCQVKECEGGL